MGSETYIIRIANKDVDRKVPVFPNRVNNKYPAIIFAANRTAREPGRIKFLIVSIRLLQKSPQ